MRGNLTDIYFPIFLNAVYRQKWGILLLTAIATIISVQYALQLPNIYKSNLTVNVKPYAIQSSKTNLNNTEISNSLQFIIVEELKRSVIQDLITKHNLFKDEDNIDLKINKFINLLEIDATLSEKELVTSINFSYYNSEKETAEEVVSAIAKNLAYSPIRLNNGSETLNVINTNSLPTLVNRPRRFFIIGVGFVCGVSTALLFAALLELILVRRRQSYRKNRSFV